MKTIWLCVCLIAGALFSTAIVVPPESVSAHSPAGAFSAERALADIRRIARRPHPVGSAEHARVRDYLVARLSHMGLKPRVFERTFVQQPGGNTFARMAPIANIVAVLSGTNPELPALGILAHYDTVPHSPGAADDAAGVASALEIVRALKSGPRPQRDVMLVLTDGEEIGLAGAEAFFRRNPLAGHIGIVLNFEAAGGGGRATMFETGDDNKALIARYARTARHPSAISLANALYHRMPNDTDFSVVRNSGLSGLNFAFLGDKAAYHSPLATPERVSLRSVQHLGDQALPVARDLAFAPALPAASGNAVYADLFGTVLVHYSPYWGWGLIVLALALTLFAFIAGRACNTAAVVRGFFGCILMVVLAALVLWPVGRIFADFNLYQRVPQYSYLFAASLCLAVATVCYVAYALRTGRGCRVISAAAVLAAGLSCLAGFDPFAILMALGLIVSGWFVLGTSIEAADLWRGSLLFALVLSLAVQIFCPDASPFVLWPLLVAGVSAALVFSSFSGRHDHFIALGICGAGAIVVLAQVCGQGELLFEAVGLQSPAVLVLPLMGLVPVLMPLLASAGEERSLAELGFLLVVAGVGLTCFARFATHSPTRPDPVEIAHLQDFNTGRSYLFSPSSRLGGWSQSVMESVGAPVRRISDPGIFRQPIWCAEVRHAAGMARPELSVTREDGRVVILARSAGSAALASIAVSASTGLSGARLDGRPLSGNIPAGSWTSVRVYAPSAGTVLSFDAPSHARIDVRLAVQTDDAPADAEPLPPLPEDAMAMGIYGAAIGRVEKKLAW